MKNVIDSSNQENWDNSIKVGIAATAREREEIFRFRYQIYIEEMSKQIEGIDHVNKVLYDELDDWTILLYAKIGSTLIATARINIGTSDKYPSQLVNILAFDLFESPLDQNRPAFAYVTKLMVAPPYRNSPVLYLLIAKCYEICCENQVHFGFGACNVHLLRLYEQMGFHRYTENFVDPGYGLLFPIVMLIDDTQHLRTVRSPLFRSARKNNNINPHIIEWFHGKFLTNSQTINSQTVSEEQLWSVLRERLHCQPTQAIELLQNLSESEAKKFVHGCGVYITCNAGDMITVQGDISYSYNLLIAGKLRSLTFYHPSKHYNSPGQYFGGNGLTGQNAHTEDIIAVSPSELLVLSGLAFRRFSHAYPDIAHKIVRNILTSSQQLLHKAKNSAR